LRIRCPRVDAKADLDPVSAAWVGHRGAVYARTVINLPAAAASRKAGKPAL